MSVRLPEELKVVTTTIRDNYRPSKQAGLIQRLANIPTWAESVESRRVVTFAELKAVTDTGPTSLPMPSISRTATSQPMVEFGAAYYYSDLEIEKSQQLGIPLQAERAQANLQAGAEFLDQTMAVGDPLGIGLPGMLNNTDVPTVTSITKAAGGTDWINNATPDEILEDMHALAQAVHSNTNENKVADTMLLPLAEYQYIVRTRVLDSGGTQSILDIFLSQSQNVSRVVVWDRLVDLGAGTTNRACAFDSRSEDVVRSLISKDMLADAPLRVSRGWEVDQTLITGGVRILDANGLAYMDAIST